MTLVRAESYPSQDLERIAAIVMNVVVLAKISHFPVADKKEVGHY
ncbi:MAG: hypothetical protein WA865_00795 [Spirulinaceae cyanobacterium]